MTIENGKFETIKEPRTKVAIVGFAGTTRHLAPYDDPEFEIWGLNEAHRQPWMKRITRWFQIHQRWDFTKQNNEAYKDHWIWLREQHPFPIYLQEAEPDVPSSVRFPKDEIVEKFLSNIRRGKNWKESEINEYFTSSFSYMFSLAVYLGFKHIEVYGFEMATDTEYRYQKGSTEFWIGRAPLDVEVLVPEECRLILGALYGFEVSRMINRQRLEFLQKGWQREFEKGKQGLFQVSGRRKEVDALHGTTKDPAEKKTYAVRSRELFQSEVRSNANVNHTKGRLDMLNDLIQTVDNMHMGRDAGDGFVGPEGDIDPALEDAIQKEAEERGQKAEQATTPVEVGPSEG